MVTVETALALPAVTIVTGAALWALSVGVDQLRCTQAAGAAGRAAALGAAPAQVVAAARGAAPAGAAVVLRTASGWASVTVTDVVRPWGVWRHWAAVRVVARISVPLVGGTR